VGCRAEDEAAGLPAPGEEAFPWSLENLSEEELAAGELDDEDLLMDEDEEAEWRQYDEEVRQYRELMAAAGEDPDLSGSAASDLLADVLDDADSPLGPAGGMDDSAQDEVGVKELIRSASKMQAQVEQSAQPAQTASEMQDELRELLLLARKRTNAAAARPPEAEAPPSTAVAAPSGPGFEIPAKYRERLTQGKSNVIVSRCLGPNTVVLLSRAPDQPEFLPEVTEVFRVLGVTILRGWLASTGEVAMDVFEVCETTNGQSLSEARETRLQRILERVVRAPAAREVLFEVEGQVPRLDAFFGLPADGSQPPPQAEVLAALAGGPLAVLEASDLGRALVFRVRLAEGVRADEALKESRRRFAGVAQDCHGAWECLLCKSFEEEDVLLVVVPAEDLEQELAPYFNETIVFLIAVCFTLLPLAPVQAPVSSALAVSPAAFVLVFGILAITELTRRLVSGSLGVRLSLPFIVPSPTLGTFGAISRCNSLVPSRTALFDVAAAALITAFLVSFFLVFVGVSSSPSEASCIWVNPRVLPQSLGRILVQQAEPWLAVCPGPRPSDEFIPASLDLVAGAFGAVATALNALPIGGLDGTAIAAAAPWAFAPTWLLPSAGFLFVLALTMSDANAGNLLPQVLGFLFVTVLIRPQLAPDVVFRDNVSRPLDPLRGGIGLLILLVAGLVLAPSQALP